jgi:phosphopantothenoylcysteine synthetase/decarboxylase
MIAKIEEASGFPVRVDPRSPHERSPHPSVDCYLVAPASANTVAKLALGIADNQALTQVHEAIGIRDLPVVVFPRVNAAHARHPSWNSHLDTLAGLAYTLFTAMTCGRSTSRAAHRDVNCPGQLFSTR